MTKGYRFEVTGQVQGVGYRQTTARFARSLDLRGWVRNRRDGSVEGIVIGGTCVELAQFRRFLDQGPSAAHVEHVTWQAIDMDDPESVGFTVRWD